MNYTEFEFDVRIPQHLIDQLRAGEITGSMLTTMTLLYSLANWRTGRVKHISAGGLVTLSSDAYSDRTFQDAMRRLENMGWITRHMVNGSKKDYPVTIHNYKWVCDDSCEEHKEEGAGKVHILNPKPLTVCTESPEGQCGEASAETSGDSSGETSTETSGETSDKVLSLNKPFNDSKNKPENMSNHLSNNNTRRVVVAADNSRSRSKTVVGKATPTPAPASPGASQPPAPQGQIAGHSIADILEHASALIECQNPWVIQNLGDALDPDHPALTREGFVRHLMDVEVTKPVKKSKGKKEPNYAGYKSTQPQDCLSCGVEHVPDTPCPRVFCRHHGSHAHGEVCPMDRPPAPAPTPQKRPDPPKAAPQEPVASKAEKVPLPPIVREVRYKDGSVVGIPDDDEVAELRELILILAQKRLLMHTGTGMRIYRLPDAQGGVAYHCPRRAREFDELMRVLIEDPKEFWKCVKAVDGILSKEAEAASAK